MLKESEALCLFRHTITDHKNPVTLTGDDRSISEPKRRNDVYTHQIENGRRVVPAVISVSSTATVLPVPAQ